MLVRPKRIGQKVGSFFTKSPLYDGEMLNASTDFQVLHDLTGQFTSARVYAASDCNTLAAAVPAAVAAGTSLLVGVWTEDNAHYEAEKAALMAVVQQYGFDWIVAVSVGSEDLYRGDTSAETLANQIDDVRGMLWSLGAGAVQVGHVDTWTAWVNTANNAVITACDFIGMDGYPYFQDASINDGYNVFWKSVSDTSNAVARVKPGTPIWITETGWPVGGGALGAAMPSVNNARMYWESVACAAFAEKNTFMYTLQDYTSSPSFGVVDANFVPLFDLSC